MMWLISHMVSSNMHRDPHSIAIKKYIKYNIELRNAENIGRLFSELNQNIHIDSGKRDEPSQNET